MTRQTLVGLFTVVALCALFAIFFVLENVGTQGRYKIGVHFKSAAGLHKGALVYESGVTVGVVDSTVLLDDFTVDVVLAINNSVSVPRDARFLIQAPLTGDSSLEIVPQVQPPAPSDSVVPTNAPAAVAVLPREVLPIEQQPKGTNPTSVQDLLQQGQGEVRRLDSMLAELERREPALLNTLQSALMNVNDISKTTKSSFGRLAERIDSLTTTLQLAAQESAGNLNDITGTLDQALQRNVGHFDGIVASLDASARDLNRTADHVQSLSGDPRLHQNIIAATQGLARTATTFASIAGDLHNVTSNPQTQAQLRDTVANFDAASQKANSLLEQFGGRSSVFGVDAGATPAPVPGPSSAPRGGVSPAAGATPGPGGTRGGAAPAPSAATLKNKLSSLVGQLVALQVRVSELDAAAAQGSHSPLLTRDTGPQTDFNLIAAPHGSMRLFTGGNDFGGAQPSFNFLLEQKYAPHLLVGGGLLYSRLGARAVYNSGLDGRGLGFEGRLYDPRHPTADAYANYTLNNGLMLFGGERDLTHAGRRTTFGLQYQF